MAGMVSTADVALVLALAETVEHVTPDERDAVKRVRDAVNAVTPPVVVQCRTGQIKRVASRRAANGGE